LIEVDENRVERISSRIPLIKATLSKECRRLYTPKYNPTLGRS
jgi:hypothetical protein